MYIRILAHNPEKNISAIFDSNGRFETMSDFADTLEQHGFSKFFSIAFDDNLTEGNLPKIDFNREHFFLRACDFGLPKKYKHDNSTMFTLREAAYICT